MTSYKEIVGEELNLGYPLFQRIHHNPSRPVIPKPYLSSSPNHNHINSSYLNLLPHHHHHNFGTKGDEGNNVNNKDVNVAQVMVSSRWNPTPEQLTALEELYRCGTRTPSAEQIQHITAQLGRYGKIEGKNVFYWFQNHKARERQKRRRQLQLPLTTSNTTTHANHSSNNDAHKGQGVTKIGFEDEENSCKRTPFISNKEYDPPTDSNSGPTPKAVDKSISTSFHNECLLFHETCAPFQHHHHHHHSSLFTHVNINNNIITNNNINHNNINSIKSNINVDINLEPSLQQLFSHHEFNNNNGVKTTSSAVTLQLFPISEQREDEDEDEEDLRKKKDVQVLSLLDNGGGEGDNSVMMMSSMDESNDFVPYYQFL
ncbi:hypothetical protein vseg_005299 [Gypsophila vaccaria]